MADKKVYVVELPRPPYNRQMYNVNNSFMDLSWQQWFEKLYSRVGGLKSSSNNTLEDNSTDNSESITDLKNNVQTNIDNITKLDTRLTSAEKTLDSVEQQQDIDHEGLVTAGQKITTLEQKVTTNTENISTTNENLTSVSQRVTVLENNKLFETVDTLPNNSSYAFKFVFYNVQSCMCYSLDGSSWRKFSDDSIIT